MARLTDKHYCNEMYIDAKITQQFGGDDSSRKREFKLEKINIGAIPCLVGSAKCHNSLGSKNNDCPFDMGGYFIISGREKAIVARERIVPNQLFVNKKILDKTDVVVTAECRVAPELDSLFTKVVRFNLEEKKFKRTKKPQGIWKYLNKDYILDQLLDIVSSFLNLKVYP